MRNIVLKDFYGVFIVSIVNRGSMNADNNSVAVVSTHEPEDVLNSGLVSMWQMNFKSVLNPTADITLKPGICNYGGIKRESHRKQFGSPSIMLLHSSVPTQSCFDISSRNILSLK